MVPNKKEGNKKDRPTLTGAQERGRRSIEASAKRVIFCKRNPAPVSFTLCFRFGVLSCDVSMLSVRCDNCKEEYRPGKLSNSHLTYLK